ncbi:hypothetical protein E2562_014732 [Oryza meyeriana var. granulata]|uniref:Uncharacterized protein n=1 Tax=Oryza meyeriana var. granulata TaxID=110450 RepID=A0A6G1BKW6_9ORYZ|nr:hypothetical protein E2562_014732 [Oryza meyeriana var. granulata]
MSSSERGELLQLLQNISSMEMTMAMGSDTLRQGSTTTRNLSHTAQVRRPYDPSFMYASDSGRENDMGVKGGFALDHMN